MKKTFNVGYTVVIVWVRLLNFDAFLELVDATQQLSIGLH